MPQFRGSRMDGRRWGGLLLAGMIFGASGWIMAPAAEPKSIEGDEVDRSMAFVEKTVQATNLLNERKLPEALALFQELSSKYADLDEDGYVAMSLGDCLHAMGRNDEARKVYQAVAVGHADLKATASMRIREMDLAAPETSDALIEDLRRAAGTAGDQRISAQLQLGRALQKRAASLLKEAVATFRGTSEESHDNLTNSAQRAISNQALILAEIQEDLASVIERVEKTWGLARTLAEIIDTGSPGRSGDASIADFRAEWRAEASPSKQGSIQVVWGKGQESPRITVDGRTLKLNSTQALIIQRHQQRINAAVQEALQAEQTPGSGARK